jgi:CBS domain-containing protein
MRVVEVLRSKGPNVVSIEPTATLHEAAQLLFAHRIGALIVCDARDQVVGVLSERDIVATVARLAADALSTRVSEAMSSDVVSCSLDGTLEQLMQLMTEHRIRHLPVIDDQKLVGVISIGDVVKHRITEVTDESRALTDYITLGR